MCGRPSPYQKQVFTMKFKLRKRKVKISDLLAGRRPRRREVFPLGGLRIRVLAGLVVTAVRPKADESEKSARRPKADGHSVHGRRPLHGQCHGFQRPWPSSGMLSASTDVARARRWSNHLAPSVSSGGAKQLAFLFARSPLAVGMPTQILMTRRTETHVERAPIMSFHSWAAQGGRS